MDAFLARERAATVLSELRRCAALAVGCWCPLRCPFSPEPVDSTVDIIALTKTQIILPSLLRYQNTTHAKEGDLGSELPHYPSGVTWRAGDVVEVAWTLQANHGGGYSYVV